MADEMGLGKTVQSVTFLNEIHNTYHIRGPFLVVAPLSTIPHWFREFEAWTDLNVIVFHGNVPSRNLIVDSEYYYKDAQVQTNRAQSQDACKASTRYIALYDELTLFLDID